MNAQQSVEGEESRPDVPSGDIAVLLRRKIVGQLQDGMSALLGLQSADMAVVVGDACSGKSSLGLLLQGAVVGRGARYYAPPTSCGWGNLNSLPDGFGPLDRLALTAARSSNAAIAVDAQAPEVPSDTSTRATTQLPLVCFIDDLDHLHELDLHRLLTRVRVARDRGLAVSVVGTAQSIPSAMFRSDDVRITPHPAQDTTDPFEPLNIRVIELPRFTPPETASLIRLRTGVQHHSDTVARIYRASQGNPLAALHAAEMLSNGSGLGFPGALATSSIKQQLLEESVARQLDALDSIERMALEVVAIGPVVSHSEIGAAIGVSETDARVVLNRLCARSLVRFDADATSLRPHNSVVANLALRAISLARRSDLHSRVAGAHLDSAHGSDYRFKPIAAWHLSQAGQQERAADLACAALPSAVEHQQHVLIDALMDIVEGAALADREGGDDAARSLAVAAGAAWSSGRAATALRLSAIGLQALPKRDAQSCDVELDLLWNRGRALALTGNADGAAETLAEAGNSSCARLSAEWQVRLLAGWWIIHQMRGEFEALLNSATRALELANASGVRKLSGMCMNAIGNAFIALCRWEDGRDWHVRAEAIGEEAGDRHAVSISRFNVASADFSLGRWDLAESELSVIIAEALEVGDAYVLELAENVMGLLLLRRGDLEGARDSFRAATAWSRECGDVWGLALSLSNQAVLEGELRRLPAALRLLRRARRLMDEVGSRDDLPELLRRQAETLLGLGRAGEGRLLAEEGLRLAVLLQNPLEQGNCLRVLSRFAASRGDAAAALQQASDAVTGLEGIGARFEVALALRQRAEVEMLLGKWQRSRDSAEEALSMFVGLSARREARRTREMIEIAEGGPATTDTALTIEPGRLASLCRSSSVLASAPSVDCVARAIADVVASEVPCDLVLLLMREDSETHIVCPELCGEPEPASVVASIAKLCVSSGALAQGSVVLDISSEPGDAVSELRRSGVRTALVVPLSARSVERGYIYLDYRTRDGHFSDDDIHFVEALAAQAATALENIELRAKLEEEIETLRWEVDGRYAFSNIIGRSVEMQKVFSLLERVSSSSATVLVEGESGTGKELVARAIHHNSPRKNERFVPQNCAALPEHLLESELFGHVRGAFTGALKEKRGLFEAADGGTFFLDEIADMPPSLQVKLLRVLQDGEIRRVGATDSISVDVRVIAATNKSLEGEVKAGRFRQDLFYRLNVVRVEMPPLRIRRDDIPLLAQHFLDACAAESGKDIQGFTDGAMDRLVNYNWPGNVRELENEMQRAVALAREEVPIAEKDLSERIRSCDITVQTPRHGAGLDLKDMVEDIERRVILQMLEEYHWNKSKTAEALGLSRQGLLKKIARLKLRQQPE